MTDHPNGPEQRSESDRRLPYLPLYIDDYLAGTRELSYEEKGFYIELICMVWARKGGLPNSIDDLARRLRHDRRVVRRLLDALIEEGKLEIVGDEIINQRLMRLIGPRRRQINSGRVRGRVRAKSQESRAKVELKFGQDRAEVGSKSAQIGNPPPIKSETCAAPPYSTSTSTKKETPFPPFEERPPDGRRVEFSNGKLTLFNGLRSEWLEKFDGDAERLELGLTQAAAYVQPNSPRPLEAQVSAQLARQVSAKRDSDRRYADAAARNNAGAPGQRQRSDVRRQLDAI